MKPHGLTTHGLSQTPEYKRDYQRRRYALKREWYLAYNRRYKERLKSSPEQFQCDCGRPGQRLDINNVVCVRCQELEKQNWHTNQIVEDLAITRNISPAWLLRQLAACQQSFQVWIEDRTEEIVIHGHGEYHLPLTTGDSCV